MCCDYRECKTIYTNIKGEKRNNNKRRKRKIFKNKEKESVSNIIITLAIREAANSRTLICFTIITLISFG